MYVCKCKALYKDIFNMNKDKYSKIALNLYQKIFIKQQ